ncbi:MAG: hypothetical protein V1494_05940 [Candidatus Diapherotrites archaeon]
MNVIADYGARPINEIKPFTVIDSTKPTINSVSFTATLQSNQPNLIEAGTFDESSVASIALNLRKPSGATQNIPMQLLSGFDGNAYWSASLNDLQEKGNYSFTLTACDAFGNCETSASNAFTVIDVPAGCAGKNVLVASMDSNNVFSQILSANYCVVSWNLGKTGSPSLGYLQKFNAVVWSAENDLTPIDANETQVLEQFIALGGKLLLEGSEIAFRHFDDNLMRNVAHATLYLDLQLDENSVNKITVSRKHPVTKGLTQIDLNYIISAFPDAVMPYGGVGLADWNNGKSAMVLWQNAMGTAKTIYLPFTLKSVEGTARETLAGNAVAWLLESASLDLAVNDINLGSFVVEGTGKPVNFFLTNSSATQLGVYIDGALQKTISVSGSTASTTVSLSKGNHSIEAFINPSFSIKEKDYVNNSKTIAVNVAPLQADIIVEKVWAETVNDRNALLYALVSNRGGTTASVSVNFSVDGNANGTQGISLAPNSSQAVSKPHVIVKGKHLLNVNASTATDANTQNNSLNAQIYFCSQGNILLIADDDAQSASTAEPSSLASFRSALQAKGYCYSEWSEKEKGIPPLSLLNSASVVVWSSGDYWNKAVDEKDSALLSQFNGNILFEGSDISFDHNNDLFAQQKLHATLDKDLALDENNSMLEVDGNHTLMQGITAIDLNAALSPYPDSIAPLAGTDSPARWKNASTAIVSSFSGTQKTVFIAFSIDAIKDESTRQKLLKNAIDLLSQPASIACYSDSNCGTTSYSANYCSLEGNAVRDKNSFTCLNPGTPSSSCQKNAATELVQECPNGCSNGACNASAEQVNWIVTGTGTETWSETFSESIELTSGGTKQMAMQANATVTYSYYTTTNKWAKIGTFNANQGDTIEISYSFDGRYGTYTVKKNSTTIKQARSRYYRGIKAEYSATATQKVTRTATDSGSASITAAEGTKDLGTFNAVPQPQNSGTITGITYSIEDDNPEINTWISSGHVFAKLNAPTIQCNSNANCDDQNPYTEDICLNPGTIESQCSHNAIACINKLDCGTDGLVGSTYCNGNNVYRNYRTFACSSPGTSNATCSYSDSPQLIQQCANGCSNGECLVPSQQFTWIVTGTGTETWNETVSESIELTANGTKQMAMQANATVTYSYYNIFNSWKQISTFNANQGDTIEITYSFDGRYGTYTVKKNSTIIKQTKSWSYRGIKAEYSATATKTATRTATDSGTAMITSADGAKDLGAFNATPQALNSGTISNVNYSVSDDNPNVNTWLQSGHVFAKMG